MARLRTLVSGLERLSTDGLDRLVFDFIQRRQKYFGVEEVLTDCSNATTPPLVLKISAFSPITDFDLVEQATGLIERGAGPITLVGAIPGTEFDCLESTNNCTSPKIIRANTQQVHNNQLNLRKHKRQKMFTLLWELEPELWKFDIDKVMRTTRIHHRSLCLYGVSEGAIDLSSCPSCLREEYIDLYGRASQPVIGYVSSEIPLYRRCLHCGLGYMTPHVAPNRAHLLYDKWDFLDSAQDLVNFETRPAPQKLQRALDLVEPLMNTKARTLDLGGGTGTFSLHAKRSNPGWTVIHSDFDSRQHSEVLCRHDIETRTLDISNDCFGWREFDLITAFEVIEHLDFSGFNALLKKAAAALRPDGLFLFTTPDLDSPLVTAFDFFNAYAPHHLLLFGRSWIEHFFRDHSDFQIVAQSFGADLLENDAAYFDYYAATSPTFQQRDSAKVLKRLLSVARNRDDLLEGGIGSELIVVIRKIPEA